MTIGGRFLVAMMLVVAPILALPAIASPPRNCGFCAGLGPGCYVECGRKGARMLNEEELLPAASPCHQLRLKRGFVGDVGVGRRFNQFFRSALMLQYRRAVSRGCSEGVSANTLMYGGMLNVYFDAHNASRFTPYLMAGGGAGRSSTEINVVTKSGIVDRTNLIWNVGGGLQTKLGKRLTFDISYRYADLGKFGHKALKADVISIRRSRAHEFMAGLVYNFDSTSKLKKAHNFMLFNAGLGEFR